MYFSHFLSYYIDGKSLVYIFKEEPCTESLQIKQQDSSYHVLVTGL